MRFLKVLPFVILAACSAPGGRNGKYVEPGLDRPEVPFLAACPTPGNCSVAESVTEDGDGFTTYVSGLEDTGSGWSLERSAKSLPYQPSQFECAGNDCVASFPFGVVKLDAMGNTAPDQLSTPAPLPVFGKFEGGWVVVYMSDYTLKGSSPQVVFLDAAMKPKADPLKAIMKIDNLHCPPMVGGVAHLTGDRIALLVRVFTRDGNYEIVAEIRLVTYQLMRSKPWQWTEVKNIVLEGEMMGGGEMDCIKLISSPMPFNAKTVQRYDDGALAIWEKGDVTKGETKVRIVSVDGKVTDPFPLRTIVPFGSQLVSLSSNAAALLLPDRGSNKARIMTLSADNKAMVEINLGERVEWIRGAANGPEEVLVLLAVRDSGKILADRVVPRFVNLN